MNIDNNSQIVSILHDLYRLAGCPYGDSLSGLTAWNQVQTNELDRLCEKHYIEKDVLNNDE